MKPFKKLTDSRLCRDIEEFHEKFGRDYSGPPRPLPDDLQNFRADFLCEEFNEYFEGVDEQNPEKILDALVDLVYIAIGTAYLHGYDFAEAWRRVHKANMAKVASKGEGSGRGGEFDIVKPKGWVAPDLKDLVE